MDDDLTDAELVLLGLVAERSRHGYELESVIVERGIREWTALGFSSIYYVLNKLESRGLVTSEQRDGRAKGRRVYALTPAGLAACERGTARALERVRPVHASVLVGMANSPLLTSGQVGQALRSRREEMKRRIDAVRAARARQEPVEPFVGAIFDYGAAMCEAELAWMEKTLSTLEAPAMDTYDIKRELKDLYAPRVRDFEIVDVPELTYLMVDGRGDPNTSPAYREAVEALYTVSYGVRALAKKRLGRVHTVGPLEGLWSAKDLDVFRTREKDAWEWTMMIVQPEWITPALVDEAVEAARKKGLPALDLVRLERYAEGRAVQILHVGSYDDEAPTLARLHDEFLPAHGLVPTARHHEIYLSDPRRTEPAKLKTVLRQPVAEAG